MDTVINFYQENQHKLLQFKASVETFFGAHPALNSKPFPIIHSVKGRLKDPSHLRDKIDRKNKKGREVTIDNLFQEVTDLIGIRVLHLYQDQFPIIHKHIQNYVKEGDWAFVEEPMAYTWDPESKKLYDKLGIRSSVRDTYYTSVHYLVKPNNNNPNPICCEIQVRTLFEEIWGEIDHSINYPHPTSDVACKEQLRVLSKLISTGTRLADSIYRTLNDHNKNRSIQNIFEPFLRVE
ncbi:RelA/SpoT domain-containing protein [Chitinophaga varians]|uniref:RelA/SpoT domain-containing protein n=1 Tax=Chitinophaga varians TaxID=2202339 RepID=UPI00165ED666|nr:RelA/SpoT domain-containing protein [Chitinophaga varians]MBC9908955.1 (p)ppGpp synthetase [Chitinophaga varians]